MSSQSSLDRRSRRDRGVATERAAAGAAGRVPSAWCCCSASASPTSRRCTTRPTTRGTPPPSPATERRQRPCPCSAASCSRPRWPGCWPACSLTIAQHLGTVPLILQAEVFEQAAEPAAAAAAIVAAPRSRQPRARGLGAAGRLRAHRLHVPRQHHHRHRLRACCWSRASPCAAGPSAGARDCSGAWPGSRSSCWRRPSACRPSCPGCRRQSSARARSGGCSRPRRLPPAWRCWRSARRRCWARGGDRAAGGPASDRRAAAGRCRDAGPGDPRPPLRRRRDGHQLPVLGGPRRPQRHLLRALRSRPRPCRAH